MTTEVMDDDTFDAEFAAAIAAPADTSAADAQAAADAEGGATKTPEELAAEQKAADGEAADKAETDAAAAAAKAEGDKAKTPEELAAEQKDADDAAAAAAAAAAPKPPATTAKPAEETPEQKAAREALEESMKDYEPTEDEKKALEQFKADFPNEHAAMEARFKTVDRNIDQRVYKAVQDVLQMVYKDITPVVQGYSANAVEQHFAAIHTAHKDYDAVIGLVPAWIKTQPAYLQEAMQRVYDEGSTGDVIGLVTQFKAATGRTAQSETATPAAAATPADADSLAPVSTKRTAPTPKGAPDPNDFDGAFAEAAASK